MKFMPVVIASAALCALGAGLPREGLPAEPVIAASAAQAHAEIAYLLDFVAASGCEFYRNGSTYDAVRAAAHLKEKYEALRLTAQRATAEAFIENAASRSSMTGRAYEVGCPGKPRTTTTAWLRGALARYRQDGASRQNGERP